MKKFIISGGYEVIVDDQDFKRVIEFNSWYVCKQSGKVKAVLTHKVVNGKRKVILLHRYVIGILSQGKVIDHINGNVFDNRRHNLRLCISADNIKNQAISKRNTSGFKGVHYQKDRKNPWTASIRVNKKNIFLGRFKTAKEAAKAYDIGADKYFGEFARTNKYLGLV